MSVSTAMTSIPHAAGNTAKGVLHEVRIPFACILTCYAVLGCTVLGFNRSPWQMVATVAACIALELALGLLIRGRLIVPLSAYISGVGLSLLLNYAHNGWLLFPPVFLTIASKYVFTFKDRHFLIPRCSAWSVFFGTDRACMLRRPPTNGEAP